MGLDEELEALEDSGQTELEATDQEVELEDYESDLDGIMGPDAGEADVEAVYQGFTSEGETDYDGFDNEAGGWDDTGVNEDRADRGLEDEEELLEDYDMELDGELDREALEDE